MIDTVLKKLYFFTKLSTSLLLFSAIIFFGYVFSKAYISNSGNEQSFLINEQINELFVAVKYNAESLNNIKKQIASNEKSLKDINLKVSQTDNSDIILEQLKKLLEDNELINDKIINLNNKIQNSKNLVDSNGKDESTNTSFKNLIDLIELKYQNGSSVKKELVLLQKYLNNSQSAYLEKMFVLADDKFIGVEELQNKFNILMKEYLKEYYNNKNDNLFYNYLSKFYSVEPNSNSNFTNDILKNFTIVKEKLKNKDIKSSVEYLTKIDRAENHFNQWIKEANKYVLFNNNLTLIKNS